MINPLNKKLTAVLTCLAVSPAMAQHVDILVFDADGKIGVGEYNFDTQSAAERRVHLARFSSTYVVNNPGFTSVLGLDPLPGSEDLTWEFLPLTVDSGSHLGHRSTLLYWDGTGESPEFGPTVTDDYQFSLFGIHGSASSTGADEVEPGSIIAPTPPNGTIHEHLDYFLDDNGDGQNTTLPEAGIYLVGLRLNINGLEQSDPFYMVWATPELSVLSAIQPAAAWVRERVDTLFVDSITGNFDGDSDVDGADFLTWQRDHIPLGGADGLTEWTDNYGGVPAAAAIFSQVPEPTSVALAAGFCLALIATRKRRL